MILTGQQIVERMNQAEDRLVITPTFKDQVEMGASSIDLHLGCDFLTFYKPRESLVTPSSKLLPKPVAEHTPWADKLVLHPRDFVLGATLEYVSLPNNLTAHVLGRSTWARVGLVIAMATLVHPGYAGCLTLELQNLGSAPIELQPGHRIAQLVLAETYPVEKRPRDQITCATRPEAKRLLSDIDRILIDTPLWGSATDDNS